VLRTILVLFFKILPILTIVMNIFFPGEKMAKPKTDEISTEPNGDLDRRSFLRKSLAAGGAVAAASAGATQALAEVNPFGRKCLGQALLKAHTEAPHLMRHM
jgi:hypothetical protein